MSEVDATDAIRTERETNNQVSGLPIVALDSSALPIVTRHNFWYEFMAAGHTSARVVVP